MASRNSQLVDRFGRVHTDLRVSVTDRCNLRCWYCMPPEGVAPHAHDEVLRYEEIARVVRVAAELGIRRVRLTGGEPLVRKGIRDLVAMLAAIARLEDLAMTTNGVALAACAEDLRRAGLRRVNVSLDTLDREKFQQITGRDALADALRGIEAAQQAGLRPIKLNALAIRGSTEQDVVPLARFALQRRISLRFIEYMPLGGHGPWDPSRALSGEEILALMRRAFGPLEPCGPAGGRAAREYRFARGEGRLGIVHSVTAPFCATCSRLRLSSDGQVRNCLFAPSAWDARRLLRGGGTDPEIAALLRDAVGAKPKSRGACTGQFARTDQTMLQIGG